MTRKNTESEKPLPTTPSLTQLLAPEQAPTNLIDDVSFETICPSPQSYYLQRLAVIIDEPSMRSTQDFGTTFSPVKSYFLHKLIHESTVQEEFKTRENFFKSVLYIDYICTVLLQNHSVIHGIDYSTFDLATLVETSATWFPNIQPQSSMAFHPLASHSLAFRSPTPPHSEFYSTLPPYWQLRQPTWLSQRTASNLLEITRPEYHQFYRQVRSITDIQAVIFFDMVTSALPKGSYHLESLLDNPTLGKNSLDEHPDNSPLEYNQISQDAYHAASVSIYALLYEQISARVLHRVLGETYAKRGNR